jgi:abortive infection alpha-like protein
MTVESPTKLNVDIKVGEDSTKQLVEILKNVLAPGVEVLGAVSDHIRIYRTNAVLKAFKKTAKLAEDANVKLIAPPVKFLFPYIEACSLENDDDELGDLWAELLFSASTKFDNYHHSFVSVLSELTPSAAKLLKSTLGERQIGGIPDTPDLNFLSALSNTEHSIEQTIIEDLKQGADLATKQTFTQLVGRAKAFRPSCMLVREVELQDRSDPLTGMAVGFPYWFDATAQFPAEMVEMDFRILDRLGLINNNLGIRWIKLGGMNNLYFRISYVSITYYGLSFLKACGTKW